MNIKNIFKISSQNNVNVKNIKIYKKQIKYKKHI